MKVQTVISSIEHFIECFPNPFRIILSLISELATRIFKSKSPQKPSQQQATVERTSIPTPTTLPEVVSVTQPQSTTPQKYSPFRIPNSKNNRTPPVRGLGNVIASVSVVRDPQEKINRKAKANLKSLQDKIDNCIKKSDATALNKEYNHWWANDDAKRERIIEILSQYWIDNPPCRNDLFFQKLESKIKEEMQESILKMIVQENRATLDLSVFDTKK